MRLRVKDFTFFAGRPVVILNSLTATKLNVFQNNRVRLDHKGKDYYAVVDIFQKGVRPEEIILSRELMTTLRIKEGEMIEVSISDHSPAGKLIKKKMDGHRLTDKEFEIIIDQIVRNHVTEPEIAYFLAAQRMMGMTAQESVNLTWAMVRTGGVLKFGAQRKVVDKHCIGGIAGNRTTPLVVSICACAGLTFPKTSSRAITSAAGTADVIETISNIQLSIHDLKRVINKTGACLAWGGSLRLAPSDDKIIQVEKLINLDVESQMLASIMSKKIAAGAKYLVIDIPYGRGAKASNLKQAKEMAKKFREIAHPFKIKIDVVFTEGRYPIGQGVGPVLEMLDVIRVLQNTPECPKDLKEKSIFLAGKVMKLAGIKNARRKAREILESGAAYRKFVEIINAQNGKEDFEKRIRALKPAKFKLTIKAVKKGKILHLDNKKINTLCRILGTPETRSAGIFLHKKIGRVKRDEPLITLFSESKTKLKEGLKYFKNEKVMEVKF